ncbi:hypothetical protein SB778_34190, partial [Paraburkholderia sp. SIMBA_050]
ASGGLPSTLQGPSAMTLPPILQQPVRWEYAGTRSQTQFINCAIGNPKFSRWRVCRCSFSLVFYPGTSINISPDGENSQSIW